VATEVLLVSFYAILIRFARIIRRSWRDPETRGLVYLVVAVLLAGTLFYRQAEGWSILDSLFFSVTTLTTVGYGELTPTTAMSKVFTIVYIFIGIGIILAFLNKIAEREIERRHRRTDRAEDATAPDSADASDADSRGEKR